MSYRPILVGACVLALGACQQSGARPDSGTSILAPSSVTAKSVERPFKADLVWAATDVQWAGAPGTATSRFGGRCSVDSDFVVSAKFEGEATHTGHVTGTTSHCSQIQWTAAGPVGSTYSDGQGTVVAANGSTIILRYGNGTAGVDPQTGEMGFRDTFTFQGGTGLFEGASGGGEEGGSFADFNVILGGAPVKMWMTGTITYSPGQ